MSSEERDTMIGVDRIVPTRRIPHRETDEGSIELLAPRFRGFWLGWLQGLLPKERAHQRVRLDAMGHQVWILIDGRSDLGQITAALASEAAMDGSGLLERVWMFVRAMASEGWIELKTPSTP